MLSICILLAYNYFFSFAVATEMFVSVCLFGIQKNMELTIMIYNTQNEPDIMSDHETNPTRAETGLCASVRV